MGLLGLLEESLKTLVDKVAQMLLDRPYPNISIFHENSCELTSGPASPTLPRTPGGPMGPSGPGFPSLPEGPTGPGGPCQSTKTAF